MKSWETHMESLRQAARRLETCSDPGEIESTLTDARTVVAEARGQLRRSAEQLTLFEEELSR
jgi:ABC-type transporter Mla subunit MlaD